MKILILGGTQFVGRHIAEALLVAGHRVSTLTRGVSRDELPIEIERLRGNRDEGTHGLNALRNRTWDACIDVSGYTPRQVRPSAEMLFANVNRYVFISAVSVYGDPTIRPVDENHPRVPPAPDDVTELNNQTYGGAKVACENLVQKLYADRCALLRPQIIVGSHDPNGRCSYWVKRAMRSGDMLAPGDGSDHLQVIDVRDVAGFVRRVIENDLSGAFNLAGPRLMWLQFISMLAAKNVVWVPAEVIRTAGIMEAELPLFRSENGPRSGLMDVSNQRACEGGLTLSDPKDTLQFVQTWAQNTFEPPLLSPEREAMLIERFRSSRAASNQPMTEVKPNE